MIVSWHWYFGDGAESTEKSPVHVYMMPGKYIPSCVVVEDDGAITTIIGDPIRVYEYEYGSEEYPNSSVTDKCYRLPVNAANGAGVSEYTDGDHIGADWVWPPTGTGTLVVQDQRKLQVGLVIDSRTQKVFQINDLDVWKDRLGGYGYAGSRIIAEIHPRSHFAIQGEHVEISHNETHVYLKPKDIDKEGTSGYDEDGYPLGLRIDMTMHKNGKPDLQHTQKIVRVQKDGDLVYPEKLNARTLQQRIKVYEAPWILARVLTDYDAIDKAAPPNLKQMQEADYQERLCGSPLLHVTRGIPPLMNLATATECLGTVAANIAGPDGKSDSAMRFTPPHPGFFARTPTGTTVTGDFSLRVWVKDVDPMVVSQDLWIIGALHVTLERVGADLYVRVNDGVNPIFNVLLSTTGSNWALLILVRDSVYYRVYEGKTLLASLPLTNIPDFGNEIYVATAAACPSVFDANVSALALTQECIDYYYDNVTIREGNQVMPGF